MDDAFADSSVERANNAHLNISMDNGSKWPPQYIAKYDYDARLSPNSLVDINVDDDPILGDIQSMEEQSLLSGDIEMAEQFKRKQQNQNKVTYFNKNKNKNKIHDRSQQNLQNHILMQQASGIKAAFHSKLSSAAASQKDMHRLPEFESNLGLHAWCIAFFYWIPIRYLCFMGSLALFILPFLDVKFQRNIGFVEWLLYWYIQLFAIIGIFIESPTWVLTQKIQLSIYKWCRVLRRTWGRAVFYVFVSFLTFAELQGGAMITMSMFAGIYMLGMSVLMLLFSVLAAKQYRCMYWYMANGGSVKMSGQRLVGDEYEEMDSEKLMSRIESYFNELDARKVGQIGSDELYAFAEVSLKRTLSNSERYSIQLFLDDSCNGFISKEDWCKQFMTNNQVRFL